MFRFVFEGMGQIMAPDKNYEPPEDEESLFDVLAPRPSSKELEPSDNSAPAESKSRNDATICGHCGKDTPANSMQPSSFKTPTKTSGNSAAPLSYSQIRGIESISQDRQQEMLRACFEAKMMLQQNETFHDDFRFLHGLVTSRKPTVDKQIEKVERILTRDKKYTKEGGLRLIFARTVQNDAPGYTLFHLAIMHNKEKAAEALLQYDRDEQLKRTSFYGETAIHVAAFHGQDRMYDYLRQYFPNPEVDMDAVGFTPYTNAMTSPNCMNRAAFAKFYSPEDGSVLTSHQKAIRVEDWLPLRTMLGMASITGKRGITEDAYNARMLNDADDTVGFACVCDGHTDKGNVSEFVAKNLPYALEKYHAVTDWKQRLEDACHDVNKELQNDAKFKGGSTAVFSLLTKQQIVVGNVGDSRCILIQRGTPNPEDLSDSMAKLSLDGTGSYTVTALSADQVIEGDEKERLSNAGADLMEFTYKSKTGDEPIKKWKFKSSELEMSRAFGDFEHQEEGLICTPDVVVQERDFDRDLYLVLACDGVWNAMSNEEVGHMVLQEMNKKAEINENTLTEAAQGISKACLGSGDNITIIILYLQAVSGVPVSSQDNLPAPSDVESPQKK